MGRKAQITRDAMLQAAYEILRDEGYGAVNIKNIASKAGCSTQPISWQFGNMQEMRKALYEYASKQLYGDIEQKLSSKNAVEAFFETGKIYISNACDYPNVFRFLCVDNVGDVVETRGDIIDILGDDFIKDRLVREVGVESAIVDRIVADIVIYTHGLATLFLRDTYKLDKQAAFQMIYDQGIMCFAKHNINLEQFI